MFFCVFQVAKSSLFGLPKYKREEKQQAQQTSTRLRFSDFQVPCPKMKNACWDNPKPLEERRKPMANRKRNIQMKFWVTAGEKELIDEKMKLLPTQRYGAYLRKMAIDGYIIYTDTTDIKEMNKILSAISRNINQIAKRLNAGGPAYAADIQEIKERQDEIWQLQRHILSKQR